jgi:hypothetical protein
MIGFYGGVQTYKRGAHNRVVADIRMLNTHYQTLMSRYKAILKPSNLVVNSALVHGQAILKPSNLVVNSALVHGIQKQKTQTEVARTVGRLY